MDHTPYDTGSILRLITRRFDLQTLPGIVRRDRALAAHGAPPMGDLTNALDLRAERCRRRRRYCGCGARRALGGCGSRRGLLGLHAQHFDVEYQQRIAGDCRVAASRRRRDRAERTSSTWRPASSAPALPASP